MKKMKNLMDTKETSKLLLRTFENSKNKATLSKSETSEKFTPTAKKPSRTSR